LVFLPPWLLQLVVVIKKAMANNFNLNLNLKTGKKKRNVKMVLRVV